MQLNFILIVVNAGTNDKSISSGLRPFNLEKSYHYQIISVLLGDVAFGDGRCLISHMQNERKENPMFVVAVIICLLVFVALAGADLLVSNINSDELSNMGIEKKL